MAKKSYEEVQRWLGKIKHAEKVREDADLKFGYTRSLQEYRGEYDKVMPSFLKGTVVVPINEVYGFAKAFIPSVYSRDPHVSFNSKSFGKIAVCKLLESGTNAYWRELRLKRQVRRCIFDAIFAEGWMKTGFTSAFGSIESGKDETPIENNEFIRNDEIFSTRISWKHMVKDPDAVDGIHDARWVAQKIIRPMQAVLDCGLYTAKDISPTHRYDPNTDLSTRAAQPGYECEDFLEYWEVWDADKQKVLWVTEGCQEYMRDPEKWPNKFNGYPYDLLRFNDDSDEGYVPNLICSWEPQLWEKIKIRSMQMDHIKRFNRQLWAPQDSITPEQMEKFSRGDTGAINFFTGPTPPVPAQYPQIQTDIYAIENRIDLDKDNISGQPNVVRSAPQKTQSRTLGELDRMVSSFQFRQVDPRSEVEDFCAEVAYKVAATMQDYLPGEKLVKVTAQDLPILVQAFGRDRWDGNRFKFSKDDISGAEFDVDVKVGSTLPLDRQGRTEALVNFLKLGPTIGVGPNSKVASVTGKNLIGEFEMKEVEQAFDEDLAQRAKMEQIARVAAMAKQGMIEDKIERTRQAIEDGGAMPQGGMPGEMQ